ncbi:glycosyltransferase [Picosynechococcus sp. NKBG042902]|uniref:glycosyltransferase family 2 protein n=1 Tax=Picosynechococcus sp. NKBG042902 TaxID=490193 RepID=UPI000B0C2AA5
MHDLYILLPVHNRYSITQHFIRHLQRQTFQDYHLVLLDDGSTDGTATMVEASIPNLTIIQGTGDWWWAGSLHQGYLWLKNKNLTIIPSS